MINLPTDGKSRIKNTDPKEPHRARDPLLPARDSILGRPQFTIHNSPFIIHDSSFIIHHSSLLLGQSERGPRGITYQLALADIADVPSLETELHDPLPLASQLRPARSRARVLLDPGDAVCAVIKAHRAQPFPTGLFDTAA